MRNQALGICCIATLLPAAEPLSDRQVSDLRSNIRRVLAVPETPPPLDPKKYGYFEPEPNTVAERVTYGTTFGLRVPAILYVPKKREQKAPAIIVVNGHGGDKYSWYAFYTGLLYARAGAVVLTYDPIGEGERNIQRKSGTRAHDTLQRPDEVAKLLAGSMITDVLQAVRYLKSRPEVDPDRIAAVGYSLGSYVLAGACALDSGIRACVLAGGGNLDGEGEYWDRAKPMCVGIPYHSLRFLGDRPAMLYALHAHRGPTLIFNGRSDTVVNVPNTQDGFFQDLRSRTLGLTGKSKKIFDFGFHDDASASHRPFFVTRPVAEWLERHLDLPAWSPEQIARMPETHIGRWADERHVEIDPGYISEDRESGTLALGSGIPGVPRHRLDVVPSLDWELSKGQFVYEGWLQHARQQISAPGPGARP